MKKQNNLNPTTNFHEHSKTKKVNLNNQTYRKIFFTNIRFALLITSALFISCNENINKLSKIDIKNSNTLFIAPSKNNVKSADQSNRLFKITNDGIVEEVSYLDESGERITETFVPEMIYSIPKSDYLVATINYSNYLIRKSDGAVFVLDAKLGGNNDSGSRTGGYVNSNFIVQDTTKNLYYRNGDRIYKLYVSNPYKITSSPITPNTETAWNFTVSAKGDIFYQTSSAYRVAKSNGGLYNIPYGGITLNSWTGLDGKIKYATNDRFLFTVNIDANGNTSIEKKDLNIQLGGLYYPVSIVRFNDRIILLNHDPKSIGMHPFQEVENKLNTPRKIIFSYGINTIKRVINSENFYYISGLNSAQQPFLIKVNPTNDSVKELYNAGDYDIYEMNVSNNDELIFNALRMSDGIKVIGKISSTGTLNIIDTKLDAEITTLERIQ